MPLEYCDLMYKYPKPTNRLQERDKPSEHEKTIAGRFGREFFDGDRKHGYGGFIYNPIYWTDTIKVIIEYFNLTNDSSILDVGCAKGFMLADIKKVLPNITIAGIDISEYAIENSHETVRNHLQVADCKNLPFENNSFDLVISINTIHNLYENDCEQAVKEIQRVSKKDSYIVVDGWETESEKIDLERWVLTAKTILSKKEWEELFTRTGYSGTYSLWKVK